MDFFGRRGPMLRGGGRVEAADVDIEEYFEKRYVPLSNLPTPPISSAVSSPIEEDMDMEDPQIMGK
jgi:hypothetical protein